MTDQPMSCPSSDPSAKDARVFAVIGGTAEEPRASFLAKGVEVPAELLATPEGIAPKRIFRFTGKCENGACGQFANGNCQLGKTVSRMMADVVDTVPACTIRGDCRWYAENGPAICRKCPQVVTTVQPAEADMHKVLHEVRSAVQAAR